MSSNPPVGTDWAVRPNQAATVGGDGRILTGTAAALAAGLRVDPIVVRLGFVVLAVAGGWGIALYLAMWALYAFRVVPPTRPADDVADPLRDLGVGLIVLGLVVQARLWNWGFNDALVWPVLVLATLIAIFWRRFSSVELSRLIDSTGGNRSTALRVLGGGVLAVGGALSLTRVDLTFGTWVRTMTGFVAVLLGLVVIFGPTLRLLTNALMAERRERIRADERAVISSHLHDSVLQTLTLIGKRAGDSAEVQALARRQERELRQWLYGDRAGLAGTLGQAFEDAAAEVEDLHRVRVECVVVGDRDVDESVDAIVMAAREAMVNAAKFSGDPMVSLYAEIRPDGIDAFVRDRGAGFDPDAVAGDRRGIAESIVGRMTRAGGAASVRSAPGEGTEVSLHLPLKVVA